MLALARRLLSWLPLARFANPLGKFGVCAECCETGGDCADYCTSGTAPHCYQVTIEDSTTTLPGGASINGTWVLHNSAECVWRQWVWCDTEDETATRCFMLVLSIAPLLLDYPTGVATDGYSLRLYNDYVDTEDVYALPELLTYFKESEEPSGDPRDCAETTELVEVGGNEDGTVTITPYSSTCEESTQYCKCPGLCDGCQPTTMIWTASALTDFEFMEGEYELVIYPNHCDYSWFGQEECPWESVRGYCAYGYRGEVDGKTVHVLLCFFDMGVPAITFGYDDGSEWHVDNFTGAHITDYSGSDCIDMAFTLVRCITTTADTSTEGNQTTPPEWDETNPCGEYSGQSYDYSSVTAGDECNDECADALDASTCECADGEVFGDAEGYTPCCIFATVGDTTATLHSGEELDGKVFSARLTGGPDNCTYERRYGCDSGAMDPCDCLTLTVVMTRDGDDVDIVATLAYKGSGETWDGTIFTFVGTESYPLDLDGVVLDADDESGATLTLATRGTNWMECASSGTSSRSSNVCGNADAMWLGCLPITLDLTVGTTWTCGSLTLSTGQYELIHASDVDREDYEAFYGETTDVQWADYRNGCEYFAFAAVTGGTIALRFVINESHGYSCGGSMGGPATLHIEYLVDGVVTECGPFWMCDAYSGETPGWACDLSLEDNTGMDWFTIGNPEGCAPGVEE